MRRDVRSIKTLIALASIVCVIGAAIFYSTRHRQAPSGTAEIKDPALPSEASGSGTPAVEDANVGSEQTTEEMTDVPDAAQLMDETVAVDKTKDPNYERRVVEFKEAFAASEPCRYIKVINKLTSTSIIEAFAKEPIGQSSSSSDTGLLNRIYSQGAFAEKPSSSPVVSSKSEEFLMALRYAGLVDGVKRTVIDYSKSEALLRTIAAREPDNSAPLFFLSDVLSSQKKDGRALMKEVFKKTKFETYWEEVVYSIERQAEGSPDHFLVGSLLGYSIPFPEFTAPQARIKVWIEDGDEEFARSALAWAEPLVDEALRSSQSLGSEARGLRKVEFATFKAIANAARKRLNLPLDKRPLSEAMPADDKFGEHMWDAFEDLEGKKFDEDRSESPKPCDRRTMDRQYQKYLTREWRKDRR